MADRSGTEKKVSEVLDSTLASVDHAEQAVLSAARDAGFNEDDLHWIGMSVRECMVNAVVHGNRYNANKKVEFSITTTPEKMQIRIADQGEGFELEEAPDPLADGNLLKSSGRGIFLVRAFMDDLIIRRRQPEGTEVILVKNLAGTA
jgi:serine/threonine-protein kinase RsbW